jgi:DNA-binding XRE family transcriptional regulator
MTQHEFSRLVKRCRALSDLSQKAFGKEIGCSWITIWRWENNLNCPKPDAIEFWVRKVQGID